MVTHSSSSTKAAEANEHPGAPARPLYWLALTSLGVSIVTVLAMTAYSRHMERLVEQNTHVYQMTRSGLLDVTGPLPRAGPGSGGPFALDAARAIARFDSAADSTRNPTQMARIRSIRELAGQWSSAVMSRPSVAPGLASAIESNVQEFLAEEQRLYRVRSSQFHRAQVATATTVTLELVFVAVILIIYSQRIARDMTAANEQQLRLEEQAAELEEQALELEISNHELREAVRRIEQAREKTETP